MIDPNRATAVRSACWAGVLGALLAGCATDPSLSKVYKAYQRGDYAQAYRQAADIAESTRSSTRHEAAYMAGLAAYQHRDFKAARRYLNIAKDSAEARLAGDALATLGLLHSKLEQYALASRAFVEAARRLVAHRDAQEFRAQAFFYAALAQQKLGNRSAALTYLDLADALGRDSVFKQRITQEKSNYGWTIQTGAFVKQSHARRLARNVTRTAAGLELGAAHLVAAVAEKGQTLYLVQIGEFPSYAAAKLARGQLGIDNVLIVPRSTATRQTR